MKPPAFLTASPFLSRHARPLLLVLVGRLLHHYLEEAAKTRFGQKRIVGNKRLETLSNRPPHV